MKKKEKPKHAKGIMRKNKDSQRLSQDLETIAEIGRIISSTLNIDEVYERFAQEAKKLIELDRLSVNIINQKENTVSALYVWGITVSGRQSEDVFSLTGSATGEVFKTRSSLIIQPDSEEELEGRFSTLIPTFRAGLRSMMTVPLISRDEVIGALHFRSKKSKAYTELDLRLAERIGTQIAGAIANAQLFLEQKKAEAALQKSEEGARRLARDNAMVAEVGRIISSTLEIERVYELFAEEVRKVIPFDRISITVIDHEKGAFHNAYILGPDIPGRQLKEVISLAGSFTEEIMRRWSNQLIQTEDVDEVAGRFPKLLPFWQRGFRSFMAVPLISHDQVIGVLHVYSLRSQAYKEADVRLAENIGYQIAGAIANAQLFAKHKQAQEALRKTEEAAQHLAQENETIAEIGRIISSTLDIEEIYERFAQEAKKLIEFDRITVNIINPIEKTVTLPYVWGTFVPGRQPGDVFPLIGSATGKVYETRSILLISAEEDVKDIATRLPGFAPHLKIGLPSMLLIPLISKDEVIGGLSFHSKKPNAYADRDRKLAESIGHQIAGAIANARLFLEHKRAQEALRESEWRFRTAAESASDLIWDWDIVNQRLTWFGRIDEKLGYQPGEFPRTTEAWENIIHPEDHERVMKALDRHLENQERYFEEYRVLRKDGSVAYWIGSGTAMQDQEGQPYRMVGSVTDVTERRKMEEELLRSKKLESIGFLSGGIAHDFNNLLTGIMGNISLARLSFHPGDKTLTYLESAENLSVRASELTKRLLTFSRGGTPIKKLVLIGNFLKETVHMPLSGSNVRCEFNISEDLWPVEIDEGQMRQAIYNIVINARESMPGGGTIEILAQNISPVPADRHSLKEGKYVRASIKDHGVGIPPENLEKIFDPYFSTKEMGSQKGMGLGLAISHSIVKNHGGLITVESIVGKGSTFHIYLPASAREFVPAKEAAEKSLPAKGRVLVMDDDQVVRYIAEKFLRHLGYKVELAENGAEAVARFKKAQESKQPFNIVILDLIVPGGMGGKEVLGKLLEISPDVKAIVASGFSNDPIFSDFKRYGFKGVLAKPFDLDGLSESVLRVMKTAP
ncbi:MAG: GAF domain-containing protein [Deltaproteobacteria bacterium]|nr:GAF domain-containing protein [Deltaproteobacteria bacterium]